MLCTLAPVAILLFSFSTSCPPAISLIALRNMGLDATQPKMGVETQRKSRKSRTADNPCSSLPLGGEVSAARNQSVRSERSRSRRRASAAAEPARGKDAIQAAGTEPGLSKSRQARGETNTAHAAGGKSVQPRGAGSSKSGRYHHSLRLQRRRKQLTDGRHRGPGEL